MTPGKIAGIEEPAFVPDLFNQIMRSLLMTDAYNDAEQLRNSLETDLEIMESLEALMLLEEQMDKKVEKRKKKAVVKHLHYRRTA